MECPKLHSVVCEAVNGKLESFILTIWACTNVFPWLAGCRSLATHEIASQIQYFSNCNWLNGLRNMKAVFFSGRSSQMISTWPSQIGTHRMYSFDRELKQLKSRQDCTLCRHASLWSLIVFGSVVSVFQKRLTCLPIKGANIPHLSCR